ncbi:MAG: hypothetical protein KatS3mg087_0058 [Patescibacteria group bacterium]|nr:MAG: hypothetical protein KatS3mg087_0058 [Patescibacteria group bacterium]
MTETNTVRNFQSQVSAEPITLHTLLEWHRSGYRWLARTTESDNWKPCKTLKEAKETALDGRPENTAVKMGAAVVRLDFEIGFQLVGLWPYTLSATVCTDEDVSLKDMFDAVKIATNVYKRYIAKGKGIEDYNKVL